MKLSEIIHKNLPFVIYKKPRSGKLSVIQQQTAELLMDQSLTTQGFYFAPYDFETHPAVVFPDKINKEQNFFIREFADDGIFLFDSKINQDSAQEEHQKKVAQAIDYISRGDLKKVIISRKQRFDYREFDIFSAVLKLMQTYENSFVYLWHHPAVGTWMGATPELLGKYQFPYFTTVALAGTLPVKPDEPVVWQNKEIEEQKIVTDYIVNTIKQINSSVKAGLPKTVFQGNLAHIQTELQAKIAPDKAKELIRKLHPTPAVCGLPVKKARNLIGKIEEYDRKYYTGFLGKIDNNTMEMYVNLRCMEIFNNFFEIYVGGGIVKNSIPDKEWKETCIKTKVLLSVFK